MASSQILAIQIEEIKNPGAAVPTGNFGYSISEGNGAIVD
jgi:hypothetical protein